MGEIWCDSENDSSYNIYVNHKTINNYLLFNLLTI